MCMTGEGITLELGGDSDFSNFNTMYNTGERSEPENSYKNKIKISGGSAPRPPPPLDPRMQNTKYLATFAATITCITK